MDSLKCQTSTATPAEPGGLSQWARSSALEVPVSARGLGVYCERCGGVDGSPGWNRRLAPDAGSKPEMRRAALC